MPMPPTIRGQATASSAPPSVEVREQAERWVADYDNEIPHDSLDGPSSEFKTTRLPLIWRGIDLRGVGNAPGLGIAGCDSLISCCPGTPHVSIAVLEAELECTHFHQGDEVFESIKRGGELVHPPTLRVVKGQYVARPSPTAFQQGDTSQRLK